MRTAPAVSGRAARGFTIAEAAVVLMIVALLLGGAIVVINQQQAAQEISETQRRLDLARDAILGFVLANNRLPCPAAPGATGVEAFVDPVPSGGPPTTVDLTCANPLNGFVPAITLGIGPTDQAGYLVDFWGERIRYAVSTWSVAAQNYRANCPPNPLVPPTPTNIIWENCPAYTTAGAMKGLGLGQLPRPATNFAGLLRVCNFANCGAPPAPEVAQTFFTPAVIFSTGKNFSPQKNAAPGPIPSVHEEDNVHRGTAINDIFVTRPYRRDPDNPGLEFDDQVLWISPNVLYNRLISAGAI